MQASNFSLTNYLQRIAFEGQASANLQSITQMMQQQLRCVPFENLEVQARQLISLVPEKIVEKIIHQRRGGYCYEINGLFSMALAALGVPFIWVAARPMFYPVRRPKTHMAIVAEIEGRSWLIDLGFGSYGINAPLPLDALNLETEQGFDRFMLSKTSDANYLLQSWVDGAWANQYSFDLQPQEWVDFEPANHLNATHPDAVFVKALLVIKHHEHGRHILFGNSLKTISQGQVTKRLLQPDEIKGVLADLFGLSQHPHA